MPITPVDAQTPSLTPNASLPSASPSSVAFGGATAQSSDAFASSLQQVSDIFAADQANLRRFTLQKNFNDFATDEATKLQNAKQGLADGGKDFTKTHMQGVPGADDGSTPAQEGFDDRAKKWADDNLGLMSPTQRAEWDAKIAGLRKTVSGQALTAEFTERKRFYDETVDNQLGKFQGSIDANPAAVENFKQQGNELIDASGLSAADKQAKKLKWENDAAKVYGYAQARINPTATATQLGSDNVGYYSKLRAKESGGKDSAESDTSSAGGRYQFTDGTWSTVANSAAGRAAGLTAGGKMDPAQQEIGVRILTKQNADILSQNGVEASEKNLRMAHFLGGQGASSFISSMTSNPGASAAALFPKEAAANTSVFYDKGRPRSLSEVYNLETQGFGGATVPTEAPKQFAQLDYQQRAAIRDYAERQSATQDNNAKIAEQEAHRQWFNDLEVGVHDGNKGAADIKNARENGQLSDINEIQRVENILAARDKNTGDIARFGAMLGRGETFNPFDKEHKDAAEAGVQALGGDMPAAMKVWDKTGIVSDTATKALRGGLTAQDPQKVAESANILSNMLARNPNAFAGVQGQEQLEKAGTMFDHFVNGFGMTAQEAGQRIQQANSPEYKAKVQVRDPDVKAFQDELRKGDPLNDIRTNFAGGFVSRLFFGAPALGVGAGQRATIGTDYAELATDHFREYGDKEAAKAYALAQMKKIYGVSNGVLMKFPPEHVYPPDPTGSRAYVYEQAAEAVKKSTGETVDPKNVSLMPVPTLTAEAWRGGRPTPYAIHYTTDEGGIPMHKVVLAPNGAKPDPWIADPKRMLESASGANAARFLDARYQKQVQNEALKQATFSVLNK